MRKPKKQSEVISLGLPGESEKIKQALKIYAEGVYTMSSILSNVGLDAARFHAIIKTDVNLLNLYKESKQLCTAIYKADLLPKLQSSLERQINGYFIEETETVERFNKLGEHAGKTITTKRRYVNPSTTAVIFGLKNVDPMQWNNEGGMHAEPAQEQVFQIGEQIIKFQ